MAATRFETKLELVVRPARGGGRKESKGSASALSLEERDRSGCIDFAFFLGSSFDRKALNYVNARRREYSKGSIRALDEREKSWPPPPPPPPPSSRVPRVVVCSNWPVDLTGRQVAAMHLSRAPIAISSRAARKKVRPGLGVG